MLDAPPGSMTIKKKIPTKYKLPNLNWTSLKPGQVRGTVFSELDDEKYFKVTIDHSLIAIHGIKPNENHLLFLAD